MREHCNSNFRVRLHANAVDPEVMSDTGETLCVGVSRSHIVCNQKKKKKKGTQ